MVNKCHKYDNFAQDVASNNIKVIFSEFRGLLGGPVVLYSFIVLAIDATNKSEVKVKVDNKITCKQ